MQIINTNFTGLVQVTRQAWQLIKKTDDYGMIVNINSIVGYITPFPMSGGSSANVYPGSKHAVRATSEILRQELVCMKNNKIRVSSVSPGVVETEFAHAGNYIEENQKISDILPALTAANVSEAVLFLLTTPYNVNITEMIIKPVGEPF